MIFVPIEQRQRFQNLRPVKTKIQQSLHLRTFRLSLRNTLQFHKISSHMNVISSEFSLAEQTGQLKTAINFQRLLHANESTTLLLTILDIFLSLKSCSD